ncbi:hypothetical protein OS493_002621 [Desmophyllum pertusum]|uniref:G-protein coupled receptors family 1 profile domain-containing protein n=1 Tax=Desmophyllum pertusum TaxID=174260 RepID=A0A9X0CMS4_9CNID|nr:hypothetical protein OS493_002621 [Desmophyllum pertusum]
MTQGNSTPTLVTNSYFGDNRSASEQPSMAVIFFFLVLMATFIVIINCFVVILVWKKKILRTPANICLTSLACSDFLSGSCVIPLIIACMTLEADYSITGPRCLTMDLINRMLSISAILHLLAIAVERYVVIVRFVRPDGFLSCKKYVVIVSAVWLIPLFASLIQLSWVDVKDGVPQLRGVSQPEIIYDLICIFGFVCVPLLIIVVAYTKVFCILRRHTQEIQKQTMLFASDSRPPRHKLKERRATLIYASMIGFYIIGWFPYYLITLSYDLGEGEMVDKIPPWADTAFMFCRFSSPLVNPILYTFFKKDFKKVISSIGRGGAQADTGSTSCSNVDAIELRYRKNSNSSTIAETPQTT